MTRRPAILGATLLVAVCVLTSPGLAKAGAWTLERGLAWGKLALLYLESNEIFADTDDERFGLMGCVDASGRPVRITAGQRRPYDCTTGGVFRVAALYMDLGLGLMDGWDVRLQVPLVLHTSFENQSGLDGSDSGLGDIRIATQLRALEEPLVLAASLELKLPTGSFTTDEAVPPLGEGQFDVTVRVLAAKGYERWWISGDLGYRARLTNPDTEINVGDELLANLEGAYRPVAWMSVPLGLDLLYGFESEETGAPRNRPRRWVLHGRFGLSFDVHAQVSVELGARWPLAGQGWPADPVLSIAVMGQHRLWEPEPRNE